MDIFPGEEVQPEIEFMHPALKKKEVELFGGHEALQKLSAHKSAKLGVVAPDLNGCIIRAISYRVKNFKLETWEQGFIHRYITDEGS